MATISAMAVRQRLGEILARIDLRGEEFVIEKGGEPKAVMIPFKKIQLIRQRATKEVTALFDKAAEKNSILQDDEVERFVDQAIHESRKTS